jgi:FkbM family methyltransferase
MKLSIKEAQLIINQKFELDTLLDFNGESKSQIKQDIFVLSETGFKRNGYFVEFGATDGISLNNTYLLETKFNWKGIVAEPLKSKYSELIKNRTCHIEDLCVWSESGKVLEFNETPNSDLSTINQFSSSDLHIESRRGGNIFNVETISLYDLLEKYNAPRYIDYLSIDTEGSEYEILKNFDFEKYTFKVITCEHNHTEMRDKIFTLLTSKGYVRKYENLSQFDDWYVKN